MHRSPSAKQRAGLLTVACLIGVVVCLMLGTSRLRGLLGNTAWLCGGALLVGLPAGVLLAVAATKTTLPGRRLLQLLMLALLFVPLVVQAAAWQATAGQGGWLLPALDTPLLSGWAGAIWIHGMAAIGWVVLIVGAALRSVPRELEEEALQDAPAWRVLLAVSLRRALAGVAAAALWVAVVCTGEIVVTDLFQVRTFAEEVYTVASLGGLVDSAQLEPGADPTAAPAEFLARDLWLGTAAWTLLALAAVSAVWRLLSWSEFLSLESGWRWNVQQGRWAMAAAVWLLVAVVVAVPLVSLLGKAGEQITCADNTVVRKWSAEQAASLVLRSPWEFRREAKWSLVIGGIAAVVATTTGLMLAWTLRTRWLPAWPVAGGLAFCFAVPAPLLGVWTSALLNRPPDSPLGLLTWCYDNTVLAPLLVQTLRALPLATLVLSTQLASVPQEVLDSATSEGAGWWRQLLTIATPLRWPAVVAAFLLSLVVCLGEVAATLLVAPPGVSTLSIRIFGLLHYGAEDRVAALCLALALVLGVCAAVAWCLPSWRSGHKQNL